MTGVGTAGDRITVELSSTEIGLLRTVLDQAASVVRDEHDPATGRLYPDAYPGDLDAATEFHRLTAGGLREGKLDGIARVLAGVASGSPIELSADDASAWLPPLTDARLILAERLGIRDEESRPEGLMADVYAWLGELQWLLVEALDALDGVEPDADVGPGATS